MNRLRYHKPAVLPALMLALSGCKATVLAPSGDIAARQRDLLVQSTLLMLLIIVPVIALTVIFAWRYRASNREARYEPDWDHSTQLELVIWGAPLLIIICLGAMTWMGSHLLDPFRRLDRIAENRGNPVGTKVLEVQAIALDWKWLFIYPQYGVATVNQLAAPVDRPIDFQITASSVMNSLYIPALAGQIYAMPGMETQLHAVMNQTGIYQGFSANYSGAGFSGMHFAFQSLPQAGFDQWIGKMKQAGGTLDRASYLTLEQPSENVPPRAYGIVQSDLYERILNLCVPEGKMCLHHMMAIDARGGMGLAGIGNVHALEHDKTVSRATQAFVNGICALPPRHEETTSAPTADTGLLKGAGLIPPYKRPTISPTAWLFSPSNNP